MAYGAGADHHAGHFASLPRHQPVVTFDDGLNMLDPQAQALMQLMIDKGVPPVNTQSPSEARAAYRSRRAFTQPDAPEVFKVEDKVFSANSVNVPVRVYHPHAAQTQKVLPGLVYVHGGGWTIGDLDTHDVLCRSLCLQAEVVVVSVDYRMGPEHKFPAAYEDTVAAFNWTVSQAESLGIDPHRIAVGALDCAIKKAWQSNPLISCLFTPPRSCGKTQRPITPMAKATCSPKSPLPTTPKIICATAKMPKIGAPRLSWLKVMQVFRPLLS
jgi:hypothetical protein